MKTLTLHKPPDNAIRDLIAYLFTQKRINGVFTLTRKNAHDYAYTLITDPQLLDQIAPTFPVMPMNAGKLISRLTMVEATKSPIAVILRPCELRALYELVKLEQAHLDNLLFISFTCKGVFSLKTTKEIIDKNLEQYWSEVQNNDAVSGLRETCTICDKFIPENADIIVALADRDIMDKTDFLMNTDKGHQAAEGLSDEYSEQSLESDKIVAIKQKRLARKKQVFADLKTEELGWNNLINLFGRCISCRACSSVCPICYCSLCYINSEQKDTPSRIWENYLKRDGSVRIPDDTVMYHLVRLTHVSLMCVGCGMCSDVCPVNIPIASIFTKVGDLVQDTFKYTAGQDLEQEIPLVFVHPEDFVEAKTEEK